MAGYIFLDAREGAARSFIEITAPRSPGYYSLACSCTTESNEKIEGLSAQTNGISRFNLRPATPRGERDREEATNAHIDRLSYRPCCNKNAPSDGNESDKRTAGEEHGG